jgi:hypothetical protein
MTSTDARSDAATAHAALEDARRAHARALAAVAGRDVAPLTDDDGFVFTCAHGDLRLPILQRDRPSGAAVDARGFAIQCAVEHYGKCHPAG